jgi:hypothetical protein
MISIDVRFDCQYSFTRESYRVSEIIELQKSIYER